MLATAGGGHAAAEISDGAPIPPDFAETLYARVRPLQAPDGCRLARFDTSRYRITIGLVSAAGTPHSFDLATQPALIPIPRRAGAWAIGLSPAVAADCPTTVAAIERILGETAAPTGGYAGGAAGSPQGPYLLLAATLGLLLVGTVSMLFHAAAGAPTAAVVTLALLWVGSLALRLWLSPQTFLHEYYHIAETVPAYFSGELAPGYGKTGPVLFRLVARGLGRSDDVRIIFLTNAVVSSLAVPATALLVLNVVGQWAPALFAASLLALLPQHLRFSAAEDLFVQSVTFGLWSLAFLAHYQRTRHFGHVLLGVLAASLATQTRPEMIFFPGVVGGFLLCTRPRDWRLLFAPRTLGAGVVYGLLLVPHALDVLATMHKPGAPAPHLPLLSRWFQSLAMFDPAITPVVYPLTLVAGAAWTALRHPGWLVWIVAVYAGFTVFALSMFDVPQYHLRAQNLPNSYLLLLGAGAVPLWMAAWGRRRRLGAALGVGLLALSAVAIVPGWRDFIGELKDQQLEWAFLDRQVPALPAKGTLLTAAEAGGRKLDAFPEFLLRRSNRGYAFVDVRAAAEGAAPWPAPGGDLLFYQGMFCYFAFPDEPPPDPMTAACRAVHERYATEPLMLEDLHTEGFSVLRYAHGGRGTYRIGFYRLTAWR